jgi:hypothetical protein
MLTRSGLQLGLKLGGLTLPQAHRSSGPTLSIDDFIHTHGFNYRLLADDTRIYISSRDVSPSCNNNKYICIHIRKPIGKSQLQWFMPVIPATQETKAGGL